MDPTTLQLVYIVVFIILKTMHGDALKLFKTEPQSPLTNICA